MVSFPGKLRMGHDGLNGGAKGVAAGFAGLVNVDHPHVVGVENDHGGSFGRLSS